MDTIVALASAPGRAGVAVIRVSGDGAWRVCEQLCGAVPAERRASLRALRGFDGAEIDHALVIAFGEGASFTGEKVVEFHVHGSPAVVSAVLDHCLQAEDVRAAEPGEFTWRAYEAGRLSLTQVEGLADLLNAETDRQRQQAMRLMGGEAERTALAWREALVQALVLLEAGIDFADEELPAGMIGRAHENLSVVSRDIVAELAGRTVSERLREGFEVAIVGKVNVGKSTLLNVLAGREAAITSEHAGTTRDVIEVRMDLHGFPVTLIDTAGLRVAENPVEAIGIERGARRASEADLRVYLKDGPDDDIKPERTDDIVILSKCDFWKLPGVSGKTGDGVDALVREIGQRLGVGERHSALFSRARHFSQLERSVQNLDLACEMLAKGSYSEEVVAELAREAVSRLDMILGRIDVEDVLGGIFASFCIGK